MKPHKFQIHRPSKRATAAALAAFAPTETKCKDCGGHGAVHAKWLGEVKPCVTCNGTGVIPWTAPVREKRRRKLVEDGLDGIGGTDVGPVDVVVNRHRKRDGD